MCICGVFMTFFWRTKIVCGIGSYMDQNDIENMLGNRLEYLYVYLT